MNTDVFSAFLMTLIILMFVGAVFDATRRVEVFLRDYRNHIDPDFLNAIRDTIVDAMGTRMIWAVFLGLLCSLVIFPIKEFIGMRNPVYLFIVLPIPVPFVVIWYCTCYKAVTQIYRRGLKQGLDLIQCSKVLGIVHDVKRDSEPHRMTILLPDQSVLRLIIPHDMESELDVDSMLGSLVTIYYSKTMMEMVYAIVVQPGCQTPECSQGVAA